MVYVVLGMHKSGTTLVAEILHKSGIPMIGDKDGDPSYDKGIKYERVSTANLNKDILNSWDVESFNIRGSENLNLSDQKRNRMIEIIRECQSRSDDWGFKDPRTCLTYQLWDSQLPEHRLIAIYRQPTQVWLHYRSWRYIFGTWKVLGAWKMYNRRIIDILRTAQRDYIVLDYERLMSERGEFERLSRFVGREIIDARKESAYRKRSKKSTLISVADWLGGLLGLDRSSHILGELDALRSQDNSVFC